MSSYDTPPAKDVFQEDELETPVVQVEVANVVRMDQMPATASFRNFTLNAGDRAQRIANEDPKRKRVLVWLHQELGGGCDGVCIAASQDEANDFKGAIIWSGGFAITRYEFDTSTQLWVRPTLITVGGSGDAFTFGPSTDAALLSVALEQWAR